MSNIDLGIYPSRQYDRPDHASRFQVSGVTLETRDRWGELTTSQTGGGGGSDPVT